MIKIYVIAPDKASGYAFCDVMARHRIDAEFHFHNIRPRVFNNVITESGDVLDDMNKIFSTFTDQTKSVVIACNTLQLWLDAIDPKYKQNVKIYTTFEACEWKFKDLKTKPLWLGTTPLVHKTKNFPTLISYKLSPIQDLVQELIWRIKMIEGDAFDTASDDIKKDVGNVPLQKQNIAQLRETILAALVSLGIKHVIMGCTEIPLIFDKPIEQGITFIDPADVLAEYIKSQSVAVIFAGGTISSLADDQGTHVGGKVFDLLEKLNEKIPGSYKNFNVTKSKIVYSGLSENMTIREHKKILQVVRSFFNIGISRIIVTHGTDSMEQTARFLSEHLAEDLKMHHTVIALTGSNEHAGHQKSDAWDNLRLAIADHYHKAGVYIAFAGKFIPALSAVKNFYLTGSMSYSSSDSNEYKNSEKQFQEKVHRITTMLDSKFGANYETTLVETYDVNIIRKNHDAFLRRVAAKKPRVVLFRLYHSGTANTLDPVASVSVLVQRLIAMGIICFGATENGEPTDLALYESSRALKKAGMIPLYDMLLPVALHKLELLRLETNNYTNEEIIDRMMTSVVGEINVWNPRLR